jgi:hypothetical protein
MYDDAMTWLRDVQKGDAAVPGAAAASASSSSFKADTRIFTTDTMTGYC